jgi:hypothetical protein
MLIERYNGNPSRNAKWSMSDFQNRTKSLKEAIEDAVYGYDPERKRDYHQRRIDKDVLEQMTKVLQHPLVLEELERCENFEQVMAIVYSQKIKGFGSLAVYDTALRLGAYLGHYPSYVFLHAGTEEGASNLIGKNIVKHKSHYFCGDESFPYVSMEIFPKELQELEPYHLENFLCHYKDELKDLT